MTRQVWATDEQRSWLESQKAAFIEAKQKGAAALKGFYPAVFVEFRKRWPMDSTTQEEITVAGSVERATKVKREKCDKVRCWFSIMERRLTYFYSV